MTRNRMRNKRIKKGALSLKEFLRIPVGGVFYFFDQKGWHKSSRQAVIRLSVEEDEILVGQAYSENRAEIRWNIPMRADCFEQRPARSFFRDEQSAMFWYKRYSTQRWKEWRKRE